MVRRTNASCVLLAPVLVALAWFAGVLSAPPGDYAVCVVGSGGQGCGTFKIVPAAQVLGAQITRPDQPANAAAAPASNGSVSGVRPTTSTPLARTGMNIGLLVMLGVGLLAF